MQIELIGSFLLFALLYVYHFNKRLFVPIALIAPLPFILISPTFMLGMFAFIFGAFFYLYGRKISTPISMALLLTGLYFAGIHSTSNSYTLFTSILGTKTYVLLNFLAGVFIVYSVLMNETLSKVLDKKALVKLGGLSFSIYLLHIPLIYIIAVPSFNFIFQLSQSYLIAAVLASCLFVIITFILSHFYTKYVDQLSINIANKIEKMSSGKSKETKKALS